MARVTLSFDNGPSPDVTPFVMDELAQRDLQAYFCIVGRQLQKGAEHVAIVQETLKAGHKVVNHSLTHGVALGDDVHHEHARREIETMDELMTACLGDWGEPWFRPFGRGGELGAHLFSRAAIDCLQSPGYSVLIWNSVPRDWELPDDWAERALSDINAQSHTVLVLHDINTGAMVHLPRFLDTLLAASHEITMTLPESCVPMRNGEIQWPAGEFAELVA